MNSLFQSRTALVSVTLLSFVFYSTGQITYPIVDTGVDDHYDNTAIISATSSGQAFHGQDATYNGNQPSYTDNGDGTITDNVTGLMWEQDMGVKISFDDAFIKASNSTLGGHSDWRVPTIKELVSLALFTGRCMGDYVQDKFIDTNYFNQPIGNTAIGEREIDAQTWSSTEYTGLTMFGDETVFGYNFVDGRLKGYPKYNPQSGNPATMYFRMVRNNTSYGTNNFVDNGDGTITDLATGLMWQQADDATTRDWENSLSYAEGLSLAGHDDWRLPNAKELHSILDYTRCPDATSSPAIDPLFSCTSFNDPAGNSGQYGYYWTGSPLQDGPNPYTDAVYICFGEAQGEMESPPGSGNFTLVDTHGAGAIRNDPKTGVQGNYPQYFGPQNDVQYVFNYTRCVRTDPTVSLSENESFKFEIYPNPAQNELTISSNSMESISVLNALGQEVIEMQVNQPSITLNTATLTNGVYFVLISSKDGTTATSRVVISQ
ncbi:MAG: DUF1566 domain-containing protein [Crocinitomicaceae bacterium]|nr:DUF1566 domain-containing protein [Crocinitomicaceae bacterium]